MSAAGPTVTALVVGEWVIEGVEGIGAFDVAYEELVGSSVVDNEQDTVFGRFPQEHDGDPVTVAGRKLPKLYPDGRL
jgi:hypothetical protein